MHFGEETRFGLDLYRKTRMLSVLHARSAAARSWEMEHLVRIRRRQEASLDSFF
jgi:hypothetical protein